MIGLILDHLWQSTLFVAAAGFLTVLFRANSARVRYGIWLSASLKFLFPLALVTAVGRTISDTLLPAPSMPPVITALDGATEPFSHSAVAISGLSGMISAPASSWDWGGVLVLIWFAGFASITTLWLRHWLHLHSVARTAVPIAVDAPVPVKSSPSLLEPGLVGIFRPVLLLPAGVANQLSARELDTVVTHEVCHWRRWDNLTAAMHMVVEAIFWFYPLVWWLETRLIAERERACDEDVIAAGRDPEVYAESILKVCKFYVQSPLYCASGVSGADLKKRVRTIMDDRQIRSMSGVKKAILAGVAAMALGGSLAAGMVSAPDAFAEGRTTASPGTEAALRHLVETWERHEPDFNAMTPAMAQVFMQYQVQLQRDIDKSGPLKSITFRRVSREGWEVYSVAFANALSIWNVAPLTADGKIPTLGYHQVFRRSDMSRPSPGTEAALLRQIEGWERHQPAFAEMSPTLRASIKQQAVLGQKIFDDLGPLKAFTFDRVDANGLDVYDAVFENGRAVLSTGPLSAGGRIDSMGIKPAFHRSGAGPSPGTEASPQHYIEALEKDSPDYNELTPAMAALLQLDLAETRTQFKTWGRLISLRFRSVSSNGLDMYDATFEHGHGVWQISPLTNDGRVQWLFFDAV